MIEPTTTTQDQIEPTTTTTQDQIESTATTTTTTTSTTTMPNSEFLPHELWMNFN